MLEKLRFYLRHSINDLRVNGQRTLFALLCIAAGVAAIVSLQTLGVMIEDTLTGSVQESNRGDIRVEPGSASRGRSADDEDALVAPGDDEFTTDKFTMAGVERIREWLDERFDGEAALTYRQPFDSMTSGVSVSIPDKSNKPFVIGIVVETDIYPFYGEVQDDDGRPLSELINAPTDVVFSQNLADELDAEVGDIVQISGASEDFTLRGIVPTSAEGGFEETSLLGALLGYYYLDVSAVSLFPDIEPGADVLYIRLPDPDEADRTATRLRGAFFGVETTTTTQIREQNTQVADAVNQLVVVMGLVSLLIGGIGIVNTMLVVVSRRTTEIAVLKTVGLEGEQITLLFMVESVLMGLLGSLLGVVLGWAATFLLKGGAEAFLAQSLTFRLALEPAVTGIIVGMLVTTIFGFLPTIAAGQVRPNLVLRPSDTVVPRAGRLRSFVVVLVVMLALSAVAQGLIGDLLATGQTIGESRDDSLRGRRTTEDVVELPEALEDLDMIQIATGGIGAFLGLLMAIPMLIGGIGAGWTRGNPLLRILRWLGILALPVLIGLFGVAVPALLLMFVTFIIVGILYLILLLLIWLVGRFFPTFRFVDLKLALRSMLSTKGRAASTLLALVVGVFTLSLLTMLADSITNLFERVLIDETGGNVIVLAAGSRDGLDRVEERLDSVEGVNSYAAVATYSTELISIKDVSADRTLTRGALQSRIRAGEGDEWGLYTFNEVDARGLGSNLPDVKFLAGRQLDPSDTGPWDPDAGEYPPIVISIWPSTKDLGIEPGDLITFNVHGAQSIFGGSQPRSERVTFRIAGMVDRTGSQVSVNFSATNYAPQSAFPDALTPNRVSAIVDVDEDQIGALRRELSHVPGVFVLETRFLNDLINRIIDQFTSFPILVAALALFTGGVVIANSVALSTLERRREIGIMKAVGLQRERVLGMLLLEYGLMGFIGGLIGVGIGATILLLIFTVGMGGELGTAVPWGTALMLMGLCVVIALVAAILTAWGASGEKPLNILRYE